MPSTADENRRPDVVVVGMGRVGRALARALSARGWHVRARRGRAFVPSRGVEAKHVVLCVRDQSLPELERALATSLSRGSVVVHCAGRFGPEILPSCKKAGAAVGQMHPLLSFAGTVPSFVGATFLVRGDRAAVRFGREIARTLGAVPRALPGVSPGSYHAAAAVLANGLVALAEAYRRLLGTAVNEREAMALAVPLAASVLANLHRLGPRRALTGPVRRGDVDATRGLLERAATNPSTLEAVRGLLRVQLELVEKDLSAPDRAALSSLLAPNVEGAPTPPKPSIHARSRAVRTARDPRVSKREREG